jgi:phosphoglycerate dehydrogenase-like enzyme
MASSVTEASDVVGGSGRGKKETVAVLGLGRLGLCFAVVLEQAGYKVLLPMPAAPFPASSSERTASPMQPDSPANLAGESSDG